MFEAKTTNLYSPNKYYNIMTTIKAMLDYRPDKQGRHTLIFQIIHERKRGTIFSPYRLLSQEFDPKKEVAIATSRNQTHRALIREVNSFISSQREELQRVITELKQREPIITPRDITAAYRQRHDNRYVRTFMLTLIDELQQQGKHGTASTYKSTLTIFEKFAGNIKYQFDHLNESLLTKFENYMQLVPLQRNTITFYLRTLRAVYNKAKRKGCVTKDNNPFNGLSFRIYKTRKLAVSAVTLKKVAEADFNRKNHMNETRDLFMFSFYTRGMSFVDMAYLKRDDIRDGIIRYKRHKTGQLFSVRITKPLQEIIDKYADCSPWVLPVMKDCTSRPAIPDAIPLESSPQHLHKRYKLALSRYLFHLGEISERLETDKKLTFNVARHSWATLARTRGIPVAVISESLGHTSEKTTNIYLDELDARELDRANEIVTQL